MRIQNRLFLGYIVIILTILGFGIFSYYQFSNVAVIASHIIPSITEVERQSGLDIHAQNILYYDEVLTQSARNYAFTQDDKWKDRYFNMVPLLDNEIRSAIGKGDEVATTFFQQIDESNQILIKLEIQSIDLVEKGNPLQAQQIFESQEYQSHKEKYRNGLLEYAEFRGNEFQRSLTTSSGIIVDAVSHTEQTINNSVFLVAIVTIMLIVTTLIFGILFSRKTTSSINKIEEYAKKIASGDFSQKIGSDDDQEFADLIKTFNKMTESLDESIKLKTEAEKRFRTLYNDAPTLNRTINTDGKIIDCNDIYAQRLGYSKEEVIGASIFDHCVPEYRDKLEQSFNQWRETGTVNNFELYFVGKHGKIIPGVLSATSIYDEGGNLIGSNSVIIDVSKTKDAEARLAKAEQRIRQERMMAIGELSARLAHDLRNPLSTIINVLDLMEQSPTLDKKTLSKYVTMMKKNTQGINHQVNHVLDFVRRNPKQYELVLINNLIDDVIQSISIPTNIELAFTANDVKLEVDPHQIKTVFANILKNSIESIGTDNGKIKITIIENSDNVQIEFVDSGLGIPDDKIKKIFEPLYTTKQTGTGLGLASCKNIVKEHGGKIEAKNSPTTFTVTLPKRSEISKTD